MDALEMDYIRITRYLALSIGPEEVPVPVIYVGR